MIIEILNNPDIFDLLTKQIITDAAPNSFVNILGSHKLSNQKKKYLSDCLEKCRQYNLCKQLKNTTELSSIYKIIGFYPKNLHLLYLKNNLKQNR